MPCVTEEGPTENDIVIATNGSKRQTKGTRSYLALVTQHYEEYIKIKNKFSDEKKKIVEKIVASLKPGRFMKEVNGVKGQWFVFSEKEAEEKVKQRICDETKARKKKQEAETKRVAAQAQKSVQKAAPGAKATIKAKVTKKVNSKINKTKKSRKIIKFTKKVTSSINKTNKSRKIVKDAKVSKAAKVATGINTDPPASKGGATIVRRDAVTTPTSGTDTCNSFQAIFSPKCVVATPSQNPPIFELGEDVTPNERLATEGGWTADELQILGDLFEDW